MLCEGPSDEAFFRALIKQRKLPEFCIRHTAEGNEKRAGGIDQIDNFLRGVATWEGFDQLTDILIVADNDLTPSENFKKVCDAIDSAKPERLPPVNYGVPGKPLERAAGTVRVSVLMVPWEGRPGNLESLCLGPAQSASKDVSDCTDAFANCAGVSGWDSETLRAEMKLRSILAVRHQKNPFIGFGKVWTKGGDPKLIPLDDHAFDAIADVLKGF